MRILLMLAVLWLSLNLASASGGGVHYVHSYTKRNGTYVNGHLSGNKYSGIHCHHNNCF